MNEQLLTFLSNFCIRPELVAPLQMGMKKIFDRVNNSNETEREELQTNLEEVQKYRIQKIIFPQGVYYNLENEAFRTGWANRVFQQIPQLNCIRGDVKERQEAIDSLLSSQVGRTAANPLY